MTQMHSIAPYLQTSESPSNAWRAYNSTDMAEINDVVSNLICEHSMELAKDSASLNYSHRLIHGNSVNIMHMKYGGTVKIRTRKLSPFVIVTMPIVGTTSYRCGNERGLATSTTAFMPKPDKEFAFGWQADCESLAIRIERNVIEQRLSEMLGRPLTRALDFDLEMPIATGAGRQWLAALRSLIQYLEYGANDPDTRRLLPEYEQLLITTLLYVQPHNYSSALCANNNTAPRHIRIAEKYLQENASQVIDAQSLVELTGIQESSLWRAFKQHRGCSPFQYLRFVRLQRARMELLDPSMDINVTNVAMKWGFNHLGRFALAYKKHFNESPSDTLKRRGV
ncbi:MAG: AraC family transcriptional regulator [Gammaproteobacteria bacterium]|jgi:AraC-like DNA-binding protein|nr:AraC family transcriptional regulator [Gammaproteobacteria bacterium]